MQRLLRGQAEPLAKPLGGTSQASGHHVAGVKALSRAWPVCTCGNTMSPFSMSISMGVCLEPRVPAVPPTLLVLGCMNPA